MSSERKRYLEINEHIAILRQEGQVLHEQMSVLSEEQTELVIKIIENEQILKGTNWQIDFDSKGKAFLVCQIDRIKNPEAPIENLATTLCVGWHGFFKLGEDANISFDDNRVILRFTENRCILPFALKHEMNLDASSVTDELRSLKREVLQLETLSHQLGLKT